LDAVGPADVFEQTAVRDCHRRSSHPPDHPADAESFPTTAHHRPAQSQAPPLARVGSDPSPHAAKASTQRQRDPIPSQANATPPPNGDLRHSDLIADARRSEAVGANDTGERIRFIARAAGSFDGNETTRLCTNTSGASS